ncbi:MAG: DUF4160 domain-containing protein [Bryobacteraceae bacterium]
MPTISSFYGILIRMYYNDHEPAHFHAIYGEFQATIDLERLSVLEGQLPRRALELVLDWAELHQAELRDDWNLAREKRALQKIAPLA